MKKRTKPKDIFGRTSWQITQAEREERRWSDFSGNLLGSAAPDNGMTLDRILKSNPLMAKLFDCSVDRHRVIILWEEWCVAIRYFDSWTAAATYAETRRRCCEDRFGYTLSSTLVARRVLEGDDRVLRENPYGYHAIMRSSLPISAELAPYRLSPYGDFDWPFYGSQMTIADHLTQKISGAPQDSKRTRRLDLSEEF